jgi:hypothetical protein
MTAFKTHDLTKNPGTCGSTRMPNEAYKPSWREKFEAPLPFSPKNPTSGEAFAAEDVNDLRPLRGALPRVIDVLPRFGWIAIMGADAPFFLKKGTND